MQNTNRYIQRTMKKIIIILITIIALIYVSDKVYQTYSRNYVNAHESIILINNQLLENEIDDFFNLNKGTYDPEKHKIIYSLVRKDGYLLDAYINLPVKNKTRISNSNGFDCDIEYQQIRAYRFYKNEITNLNIIARLVSINVDVIKSLDSKQSIAKKHLRAKYDFGKINILDINKNGFTNHCQ